MRLTDHDLKQLSQTYLASLSPEQLLHLSKKMLDDLRDARDRLNQTPQNSSRPSGSYAPWQQTNSGGKKEPAEPAEEATEPEPKAEKEAAPRERSAKPGAGDPKSKRKAGKQPGSKGKGRQVEMVVTDEVVHRPTECTACGQPIGQEGPFQATTGLYVLDIERSEHGSEHGSNYSPRPLSLSPGTSVSTSSTDGE